MLHYGPLGGGIFLQENLSKFESWTLAPSIENTVLKTQDSKETVMRLKAPYDETKVENIETSHASCSDWTMGGNAAMRHYIRKMDEEMEGLDSELTFGYYDKSKYTGDMIWHPILHKLMFGIQLDDIKVNGVPMGICGNKD